jgi:hypothetical protein
MCAEPRLGMPVCIATAIPDPAFDAIEHFQASWKAVGDACDGEPDKKRSPLHAAWDAKQEAVNSAYSDAEWDMVQTIPATRAGAVAMITENVSLRLVFGSSCKRLAVFDLIRGPA